MKLFMISYVLSCLVLAGFVLSASIDKRSHNHQPEWIDHCWDSSGTHLRDPFCQFLVDPVCKDPPTIENGYYTNPIDKHVNRWVNYTCNDGYQMTGQQSIQCQRQNGNYQWTQEPSCVRTACPVVPTVDNASFETPDNTEIGAVVTYTCNKGFQLVAGNTVACLAGAVWSQPSPQCQVVCPKVPVIANGYSNGVTSQTVGTSVEYNCNQGYLIVDNNSTVCWYDNKTNTASWTPLPECTEVTCAPPKAMKHTMFVYNQTIPFNETVFFINDTIQYTCASGYYFTTPEITTPAPDITTPSPDTPQPGNETGGGDGSGGDGSLVIVRPNVPANDAGDEAYLTTTTEYPTTTITDIPDDFDMDNETYNGNETDLYETAVYPETTTTTEIPTTTTTEPQPITTEEPRATQTITCQLVGNKGVWTNMQQCVIECTSIPNVDNAHKITPENQFVGAVVQYVCKNGYELSGPENITCTETGRWTDIPYCKPVCPDAPAVDNAFISNIQTYQKTKGSQLFYVCNDGYTLEGPEVVTCVDTAGSALPQNWTPTPFCRASCGQPASISNGTRTEPDNLLTGTTVTYTCDENFHLKGSAVSTCAGNGNWTDAPECVHYCQVVPDIPHSKYVLTSSGETETITFTCMDRYELIGDNAITCDNGTWSTPYPVCECVVKAIDVVFIVDGSGSMGRGGFQKTKDFVSDMVNRYPFDTTQFGLIVFATTASRQFYLNEYTTNKTELIEQIQNTKFLTGGTATYNALELARTDMFTAKNGRRPNVSQIAIVVTDGKSENLNETSRQAELLRNEGVTIYSVGVGLTDQTELNSIASNSSFVFHVDNYEAISSIEGPLAGVTCEESMGDEGEDDDELIV